ncbi:unnamed protein product [Scytosiphon promiscuus]
MQLSLLAAAGVFVFTSEDVLSDFAFATRGYDSAFDRGAGRRVSKPPWLPCSVPRMNLNNNGGSSSSSGSGGGGDRTSKSAEVFSLRSTQSIEREIDPTRSGPEGTPSKNQTLVAAAVAAPVAPSPAVQGASCAAGEATASAARSPEGKAALERGKSSARVVFDRKETRVPSVTLKLAMDRNGAVDDMAEGPKRFTSQESLDAVHRIRRDCEAVLVGVGTVVRDDPSLTVRRVPLSEGQTKQPTRVVLDRTLRLNEGRDRQKPCAILRDGHSSVVFYAAGCQTTEARAAELEADVARLEMASPLDSERSEGAVDFVGLPASRPGAGVDLNAALEALCKRGIDHILVEGGPSVAKAFLAEGLVDRAVIIRAPMEFSLPVPSHLTSDSLQRAGLELVGSTKWGEDEAECWTRPGFSWPGGGAGGWP